MEYNIKLTINSKLLKSGVYTYLFSQVGEVRDNGIMTVQDMELIILEADAVVVAVGFEPQNKLLEELKDIVSAIYAIGFCIGPRDAIEAIGQTFGGCS